MKTNYILIDYENIQPKDVQLVRDGPFKIKVFLGPNQSKILRSVATALQALGANGEYVPVETPGRNAVDFHIAYYLGALACKEPTAMFHIISKDSGFDPLIEHLKAKGVFAQRCKCIAEILSLAPGLPMTNERLIEAAVADLVRRKETKPRTVEKLRSTLRACLKLSDEAASELVDTLRKDGLIAVDGKKVSYHLSGPA